MSIRHRYVDTRCGQIHITEAGAGAPVILLHQTPRSWTEYRAVIPLLARSRHVIAMDTLGYGSSACPAQPYSIELFADGVDALADALELSSFDAVGHHTGGVIAIEVASRNGSRVRKLVLSGTAFSDEDRQRRMAEHGPIDLVLPQADGSHLIELWNRRRRFYGPDQADSLNAFVVDGLKSLDHIEDGHLAVAAYRAAPRLAAVRAEALVICGAEDSYAMDDVRKLTAALKCRSTIIAGAGVSLPEQLPAEFSAVIGAFLAAPAVTSVSAVGPVQP
jgi:pimeloyl-ACP methyl ester carboxylesterase